MWFDLGGRGDSTSAPSRWPVASGAVAPGGWCVAGMPGRNCRVGELDRQALAQSSTILRRVRHPVFLLEDVMITFSIGLERCGWGYPCNKVGLWHSAAARPRRAGSGSDRQPGRRSPMFRP